MDFFNKKNLETRVLQNAELLTDLNSVFIRPLELKKKKLSLRFVPTNLYNNAFDNNSRAPSILRNAESKLNQSYPKTRAHFSAKSTLSVHVSLGYVHGCLNLEEENKK